MTGSSLMTAATISVLCGTASAAVAATAAAFALTPPSRGVVELSEGKYPPRWAAAGGGGCGPSPGPGYGSGSAGERRIWPGRERRPWSSLTLRMSGAGDGGGIGDGGEDAREAGGEGKREKGGRDAAADASRGGG